MSYNTPNSQHQHQSEIQTSANSKKKNKNKNKKNNSQQHINQQLINQQHTSNHSPQRQSKESNHSKHSHSPTQNTDIRKSNQSFNSSPSKNSQRSSSTNRAEEEMDQSPRSSQLGEGNKLRFSENPFANYCQQCEEFRVIDSKNKLCWRCFSNHGKQDYMDIIWLMIFLGLVAFMLLLIYHHCRQNRYIECGEQYQTLNSVAEYAYYSLFDANYKPLR